MTYLAEIGVNIDAVINVNSQTYNSTDAVCSNAVASGELSHVVLTDDAVGQLNLLITESFLCIISLNVFKILLKNKWSDCYH